jgi:hypothetical protein
MFRHLKSLMVALGITTAGAGVAAADEFRGPAITIEAQVGQPGYTYGAYPVDHYQPGPNYVIPSRPDYVRYPQNLRPRRGFTWIPGRYESRYGRMAYVPGHWERVRPRRGMVWIDDHYVYRNGRAIWVPGHWERARGRAYGWNRGYRY